MSLSYNPSNQGLKLLIGYAQDVPNIGLYPTIHQTKGWNFRRCIVAFDRQIVFILQSIKPRVETGLRQPHDRGLWPSLSYNPSNQGLKLDFQSAGKSPLTVFILQSIKPRVETDNLLLLKLPKHLVFILQSIKPRVETRLSFGNFAKRCGLYPTIHQTKGWNWDTSLILVRPWSRLYPTIHQTKGWNLGCQMCTQRKRWVFILQSIKPRVETRKAYCIAWDLLGSLSYNPSNQGLKHTVWLAGPAVVVGLYPTIHQTKGWNLHQDEIIQPGGIMVFILQSIKPRVETCNSYSGKLKSHSSLSYNPSNQGLKPLYVELESWWLPSLYPTIHQTKGWN